MSRAVSPCSVLAVRSAPRSLRARRLTTLMLPLSELLVLVRPSYFAFSFNPSNPSCLLTDVPTPVSLSPMVALRSYTHGYSLVREKPRGSRIPRHSLDRKGCQARSLQDQLDFILRYSRAFCSIFQHQPECDCSQGVGHDPDFHYLYLAQIESRSSFTVPYAYD